MLCREQGGKDAAMVALLAVVLGALALQLASGPAVGHGAPGTKGLGPQTSSRWGRPAAIEPRPS